MTHEEINAAIERLKVLPEKNIYTCTDVVNAICTHGWVDTLIGLLQQADPDTHMGVPVDADGVTIHVGDEVYARRKSATYGHYYYFNGVVKSIEFEKDKTYIYAEADDEDGDQFDTCELHHGSHTPTSGQIVEDLVDEAFNLGADKERANEKYSNMAWEARKELVKQYTEQLRPLLSNDAE